MELEPFKLVVDERREIWRLLQRLTSDQRISFLKWCCAAADPNNPLRAKVTSTTGETKSVFWDVILLSVQYGLSLDVAGRELVRRVQRIPRKARL